MVARLISLAQIFCYFCSTWCNVSNGVGAYLCWLAGCPGVSLLLRLVAKVAFVLLASSTVPAMAYPSPQAVAYSAHEALAYPAPQPVTRRWFNPCQGDNPILPASTTTTATPSTAATTSGSAAISSLSSSVTSGSSATLDGVDLAYSFHAISTKATRLKRHVRELRDLYVRIPPLHLPKLC